MGYNKGKGARPIVTAPVHDVDALIKAEFAGAQKMTAAEREMLESLRKQQQGPIASDPFEYERPGDPRFHAILQELADLHDRKQADYGRDEDPLANIRASEEWGVPAWVGACIRLNDKVRRLQAYARRGTLKNESVIDSLNDIAVYAILARVLLEEEAKGEV